MALNGKHLELFFVPLLSDSPHRDNLHRPRPFLSAWGYAFEREDEHKKVMVIFQNDHHLIF
jgi:hypothetical protein